MCGRYFIDDDETISEMRRIFRDIDSRYNADGSLPSGSVAGSDLVLKTGEIFPTDKAPVLLAASTGMLARPMTWGFPNPRTSGVIINARSETAAEKPAFASAVRSARCLVPTNGFFEWSHSDAKSTDKFLLRDQRSPMLYLAGLYAAFQKPDRSSYSAFVILTVAANASARLLHDRMPLVIAPEDRRNWLTDESFALWLLQNPRTFELVLSQQL